MILATLALLLAQTCVTEIGFQDDVSECELMWSIDQANADLRGRSLKKQVKLYNNYWRSPTAQKRKPWVLYLKDGRKPARWPQRRRWELCRDNWLAYKKAARKFVRGDRAKFHGCLQAVDYGAKSDIPKSKNRKRIQCLSGRTRQQYWRRK